MTPPLAMVNAEDIAVPSRRGRMPVESGAATSMNRLRFAVLATPLVGVTFLSKFAIPPLGAQGIDISLLLLPVAAIAGSICGGIRFEPQRLMLYVTLLAILGLVQIVQPDSFSPSSMLLLAAPAFAVCLHLAA